MPAFNNVHGQTGAVTELFEVWLIDTGRFLVLRDVHPSYRDDWRWMRFMRQRRALRLFVPATEFEKLHGIETVFNVAKRGFEIRDTLKRWSEKGGRDGPALLNALLTVKAHTQLFPAETDLPVRSTPRGLVPRCWITPEEEERRKRAGAGLEAAAQGDKAKSQGKPNRGKRS